MLHVENLNRGKLAVTVITGLSPRSVNLASEMIAQEMLMERVEMVGQLEVNGNVPCLTCGHGDDYEMSAVRWLHGKDARASTEYCVRVEDQPAVWNEALRLGRVLGDRVQRGELGAATPWHKSVPLWRLPSLMATVIRARRWTATARRYKGKSGQ